jgi:hypothetical protein
MRIDVPREAEGKRFEEFKKWIEAIDDQVLLNRLEVLINRRRDHLIASGQARAPIKTLAINTNTQRGHEYFVEKWWDGKKSHTKNLGRTLPDDYDLSLVFISNRVRSKIGNIL